MSKRALASILILLSTVVSFVNTADAQIGSAQLEVRTLAGDEVVLSGVEVVVTNVATGFFRTVVTNPRGAAVVTGLAPGTYRIEARLEGFETAVDPARVLRTGHIGRLDLVLRPRIEGELEVSDDIPLVNVFRTDSSTNIVPEQMMSLPVLDRAFDRLAFLAPGVQRERWEFLDVQGSPVVGSSTNSIATGYFVDGSDFTDPYFGSSRVQLSQDAIQEMRVVNNRFDAGVGGSSGGVISVVTRSGTNAVHGSAFGFFRTEELRAQSALELENAPYSRSHLGFTIGGPIKRDRTHYFIAFEHLDEDDIALVRPGGAFTGLAEDVPHPVQRTHLLASFDHRFSASSAASAKLLLERTRQDNYMVGGVIAESHGYSRDNDNWNLRLGHSLVIGGEHLNEIRLQGGTHELQMAVNSTEMGEWFSSGSTLQIGSHPVGRLPYQRTDFVQLDDTFHIGGLSNHNLRAGLSYLYTDAFHREDRFIHGWMIYLTDDRSLPTLYYTGAGASDGGLDNHAIGLFLQDDWRPSPKLTVSMGLRYDLETNATHPNFEHPLVGDRGIDTDNIQPRIGFTWNPDGAGRTVIRGGFGRYVARIPLFGALYEECFNDVSGRVQLQRMNGPLACAELGIPPDQCPLPALDPSDPDNTGVPLPPNIEMLADDLQAPESWQFSAGISQRLGATGLVADLEATYIDGANEMIFRNTNWAGNECRDDGDPADCWLDPSYRWILRRTSEGRSEYRAVVAGLNGTLRGGHLLSASVAVASKKNLMDEWAGFNTPSDSADLEAEWGPSGSDERFRIVASAVFNLPWRLTLAPVIEYGSGQPWNREFGYDANGDAGLGGFTDRAPGVGRNDQDGPTYRQVSVRLTKSLRLGGGDLDLMIECFNLFNTTNFDVSSIDNAEFLIDPSSGSLDPVPNPRFGQYLATLPPREVQLGVRYRF